MQHDAILFHLFHIKTYILSYDVTSASVMKACVIFGYRKVPKFSDARKLCCNLPKIQEKRPNLRVLHQKDANGIANSEDPDLGLHCLPRPICPKTLDHYGIH